jgi:hypothetical protein
MSIVRYAQKFSKRLDLSDSILLDDSQSLKLCPGRRDIFCNHRPVGECADRSATLSSAVSPRECAGYARLPIRRVTLNTIVKHKHIKAQKVGFLNLWAQQLISTVKRHRSTVYRRRERNRASIVRRFQYGTAQSALPGPLEFIGRLGLVEL